tara:strand:- start:245 stop:406 length:162 start_codon:yes stop_codon:yes gene_type:complete
VIFKMIEFLKHALGLCGEPHPSLLTLLMGTPAATYILYKLKFKKNDKVSRTSK